MKKTFLYLALCMFCALGYGQTVYKTVEPINVGETTVLIGLESSNPNTTTTNSWSCNSSIVSLSNKTGGSCKVTGLSAGTAEVKCTVTSYNPTSGTSYRYLIYTVTVNDVSLEPGTWSGNTLTIGDNATSTTNRAPYNNYWTYSTTQMLYSPAEIGKSGTINSIAFKVASTSSFTTSGLKVYLGHKSSIFSSTSDYMTSSNLKLVYSGSPTLGQSTGWETLTFNQGSFNYNGTDKLVVVVATKSSSYKASLKYYCYAGSGYVLSRGNDDTTGYGDITNTSYAYSTREERPAIRMVFAGSEPVTDGIAINATNFPDAKFRSYLLSQSYGSDGILTQDEINGITSLDVSFKKIGSLKGIEHFTALTGLACDSNQLTTLDVSKNTVLTVLFCYDNKLTTLDVSKNTALKFLSCDGNNINGVNMDNLIAGLRQNNTNSTYKFHVIDTSVSNEGNVCTKAQVAAVKAKGWTPYYYDGSNYYEYEGSDEVVSLESISLPESIQLSVGETQTLTPVFTPASAAMGVTWSSADESIATVDEFEGVVTAISPGTTTIYVIADDAEHLASCQVTVTGEGELTDISQMDNVLYVDNAEGIADGRMTFYVKMKNSVVAEGFFFRLYLPEGFNFVENLDGKLDVSLYTDEDRFNKSNIEFSDPYIDEDGSLVVDAHGKNGYNFCGNDGKVVRIRVMVPENMPVGSYPLLIKNGAISDNLGTMWPKGTKPDIKCGLSIVAKVRGDANADAIDKDVPTQNNDYVNAGDYVTITHYILGLPYDTLDTTAADANGDGVVNGADLTTITLLKKKEKVAASAPRMAKSKTVREREAE